MMTRAGDEPRLPAARDDHEPEFLLLTGGTPARVILKVHGQADLDTAPRLRAALADAVDDGASDIVVDLSAATFIDSTTLGVLVGAAKRLRPCGGALSVVVSDPNIRKIFEITLLDRILRLQDAEAAPR